MELSEYLAILIRRRRLIVEAVAVLALVAFLASWLMPKEYDATILVAVGRPAYQAPELPDSNGPGLQSVTRTQEELLQTRAVLEAVIKSEKLTRQKLQAAQGHNWLFRLWPGQAADRPLPPDELHKRLKVTTLLGSSLIEVRVRWPEPVVAQQIANALGRIYVEENRLDDQRDAATTRRYIETQLTATRRSLSQAEAALRNYKDRHQVFDMASASRALDTVAELEREREQAIAAQAEAKSKSDMLGTQMAERAHQLRRSLDSSRSTSTDSLYRQLEQEKALADLEVQSQGVKAHQLAAAIQGQQQRINRLPQLEQELAALTRTVEVKREAYRSLEEQLGRVQLAEVAKIGTARLVQGASLPQVPSVPRPFLNLLLAVLAGAVLGLIRAFLAEGLDKSLRDRKGAEQALGLPVLGLLPEDRPTAKLPEPEGVVVWQDPMADLAEAIRSLRSGLSLSSPQERTILVLSPGVGEGKTTVSLNLAVSMAQIGKKVLVIDADLRRPSVHRQLQIPNNLGLSDVLSAPDSHWPETFQQALRRSPLLPHMSVLTGGIVPVRPADLLESDRLGQLLAVANERFNLVILDGPPALAYADGLLLAARVDGVLLVVDAQKTPKEAAKRTVAELNRVRARVLGVVLNRSDSQQEDGYAYYPKSTELLRTEVNP